MGNKNVIYTKGFINDNGNIEVPGVFFEDGAIVDIAISVLPGKFEVAMMPSEISDADEPDNNDINRICEMFSDCSACPVIKKCKEDLENENQDISGGS